MNLYLADINKDLATEPIRKGFGRGLLAAGKLDVNVVAACADLTDSTQMNLFKAEFPDRFIEIGVAEQNLATVGAGLAAMGKIPFVSSYAAFSPGRNWEQIRTTACLNERPVKIVGSHAGVSVGPDGATHQMLEDIALMYPSDPLMADSQYWLGESFFQRQLYRDAAESFLAVTTKFDKSGKAPDALLRLGQSLAALKEKEAACAALGEVTRKYPRASGGVKAAVDREQKRIKC